MREDEGGCSAEHLRKAPLLQTFKFPKATNIRSDTVLLFSSLNIFNTFESLFAAKNLYNINPQDLDGAFDNSSVIVAGLVIQLFCSASGQLTAPHIQWTRNNITIPETAQLPHLMVKSRTQNNTIASHL